MLDWIVTFVFVVLIVSPTVLVSSSSSACIFSTVYMDFPIMFTPPA